MNYGEAFTRYGAALRNPQWSVCAENAKGELFVSLWHHHFRKAVGNTIRCVGKASRWSGPGNAEFRESMNKAFETNQVIRAVIARTDNPNAVERGEGASKLKNTFSIKEDWFGKVVVWDGDTYEIEFERRN